MKTLKGEEPSTRKAATAVNRNSRPLRFYLLPAAALFVFIQSFSLLSPILLSLLMILLLSLAVDPLVARVRSLTGKRAAAAGIVAGCFVLLILVTGWAFFQPIKSSFSRLSQQLPSYWERVQKPLIRLENMAGLSEEKLQAEVAIEVQEVKSAAGLPPTPPAKNTEAEVKPAAPTNTIRTGLGQMIQTTVGKFTALAFSAVEIGVVLVTVFFGVTFTLMNPRPVFASIFSVVPEPHHAKATMIVRRIGKFMPNWAMATLLAMAMVGTLVFLLMWPLFGFVDALVLGLIAGVLEAIPYLGPILALTPALLFALGEGGTTPLWVLGIYAGVQFLENNVIAPLVMAGGMKLHPVAVMISMLLCVTVFGMLGLIIAAPMVAIINILHEELFRKRFLPNISDEDLDQMARSVLREKRSAE